MDERELMARANWAPGPWDHEPDFDMWPDASTGYMCVIRRQSPFGHLNGYVRLEADHPLHGVSFDDKVPDELLQDVQGLMHQPIGRRSAIDLFIAAIDHMNGERQRVGILIDVHGSVSFSAHARFDEEFLPPGFWWGFACLGGGDLAPGMEAMRRWLHATNPRLGRYEDSIITKTVTYREWPYVRHQVESMARQLHAIAQVFEQMNAEARAAAMQVIQQAKERVE